MPQPKLTLVGAGPDAAESDEDGAVTDTADE